MSASGHYVKLCIAATMHRSQLGIVVSRRIDSSPMGEGGSARRVLRIVSGSSKSGSASPACGTEVARSSTSDGQRRTQGSPVLSRKSNECLTQRHVDSSCGTDPMPIVYRRHRASFWTLRPLNVPRELLLQNQILRPYRARRATEQHAEPHNVGKKTDDRSRPARSQFLRATLLMKQSRKSF